MIRTRPATPKWFQLSEQATPQIMAGIATAAKESALALQVKFAPTLAHWYLLDTLHLANLANREGMHANALALTRQALEAITIVEIGICQHHEAETTLVKWNQDKLTAGNLRAWLEKNVWPQYGSGLWNEPWSVFMRELASALQPYAHYGSKLAQWQVRLMRGAAPADSTATPSLALIELRPRAYDPQKATRITLFHAVLTYALGRIWISRGNERAEARALIARLGIALGKSRYLDGHATDWSQQFWAMLWDIGGKTVLE